MWRRMCWIKGYKQFKTALTPYYVPNQAYVFTSTNEVLECDFNIHELENCLRKKDSAPGVDSIAYYMIFNLHTSIKLYLFDI